MALKSIKTYGKISLSKRKDEHTGKLVQKWKLDKVAPHVCIRLKAVFRQISSGSTAPFYLDDTPEICDDILWFTTRYPMDISDNDLSRMKRERNKRIQTINDLEEIFLPDYKPKEIKLNDGFSGRDYQLRGAELYYKAQRILCGDDLGLGKTVIAILSFMYEGMLPAHVTVQTHLTQQWKEKIEQFTSLKVHVIKKTTPYNLPPADVYVSKYSCLSGWSDYFKQGFFKSAVFDEIQELRHADTNKYWGAKALCESVSHALGLTATPIYNYGIEIFNIIDLLKPNALGNSTEFMRQWTNFGRIVHDPAALGASLRDQHLFFRRTRAEVGRELPPVNRIVHTVGYDSEEAKKSEDLATQLAIKTVSGAFVERGSAARELDILMRQITGVSKAKEVAEYVKILLDNGEPVLLAGWHREVYEIWQRELADYKPVLYTGSETPVQKEKTKQAFISGDTNLMIISLRSGVGLDGLQKRCKYVVFGELDWSPQIHNQVIARADREGQTEQVTAIFLVSDEGSDPVIIDLLGLKAAQSHNIIDPLKVVENRHSDDSRLKILAERFLKKRGIPIPNPHPEENIEK